MIGQARTTQRYEVMVGEWDRRLTMRIEELSTQYGRYGYRRVTALLNVEGWRVNHKRVERIWREEGLKVPEKQRKRRHLWLNDGSCVRLRPEYPNHVWSYDFMEDRTSDGRKYRILNIIDEYTKECLATEASRKLKSDDVEQCLMELFVERGVPAHIRSDNGPEFIEKGLRSWLNGLGVRTLFIEPGSPWENGYMESFNEKMRDELLNREVFDTIPEARVMTGRYKKDYNTIRPHSALGYRPPAPETWDVWLNKPTGGLVGCVA